jgi:uncharacterized lipoprotein YmbA
MNTYTWQVESLDCVPDGKVVSCIHWRLKGDDGTNTAEVYGAQAIEHNAKNPFTAYEALTKDQVISWVQEAMGIDAVTKLQEELDKQLETLANPPVITPPLPWFE